MFTPLHVYTGSSLLKSGIKIDEYLKYASKLNFNNLAISDFETFRGVPHFVHECQKYNIKPIIGIDLIIEGLLFTFFIKNEQGYKNALTLFYEYNNKRLSLNNYHLYCDGLIVVLSIVNDEFKNQFNDNKFNYWLASIQKDVLDFYLGLSIDYDDYFYLDNVRKFASEHNYKTLCFPFIKYLKKEDAIILDMVDAINNNEKIEIKKHNGPYYLITEDELINHFTSEEIEQTNIIANQIEFKFIEKRGKMIKFKNDLNMTSDEYLRYLLFESLKNHQLDNNEIYIKRVNYELDVITKLGYSDYFLLVQDYVNWAKNNNILVGPGRGSSSGSLIAYLLNITMVDPIKYNLLFERFLNIERIKMPDIDVDFPDINREDIFSYLRQKYGFDHVANILAIQTIGPKQSIRDAGRIYDYEELQIDKVSKIIDGNMSLRQNYRNNKEFKQLVDSDKYYLQLVSLASKIEGLPRQSSLHAAGVVLNDEPLFEVIPVSIDNNDHFVVEFEKDYLEEQQFLKMDILGIRNLTLIQNTLDLINNENDHKLLYKDIPYEDNDAIKLINDGKTMGIFQLESEGMRNAIKDLSPTCFEDIVALLALYRPRSKQFIKTYQNRKTHKEKYQLLHKDVEDILSPTYGIIVYEEQIMLLANRLASFSLGKADLFRRAISDNNIEKINLYKKPFIDGCINNGYSEKEAYKFYDFIYQSCGYGFNRSHSLVYAILSSQMAYLKKYYPEQFYATILDNINGSSSSFNLTISEIKSLGIKIKVPSINESDNHFRIKDGYLLFPLTIIKKIHSSLIKDIVNERETNGKFKDFFDFVLRVYKYHLSASDLNNLINGGSFDEFNENRSSLRNAIIPAIQYAEALVDNEGQIVIDISLLPKPNIRKAEKDLLTDLNLEYDALGYMISGSPLSLYQDKINNIEITNIIDLQNVRKKVNIVGVIKNVKIITNKKNEHMAFVLLYDDTGEIEFTVFNNLLPLVMNFLKKNHCIEIIGYYNNQKDKYQLSIENIIDLEA
ncbi:MAG: DNA polymerase III subunit alpha [Bacillales bacterium]|nr:DNA polymerase III subunit alpha [Bacillales bacterium]